MTKCRTSVMKRNFLIAIFTSPSCLVYFIYSSTLLVTLPVTMFIAVYKLSHLCTSTCCRMQGMLMYKHCTLLAVHLWQHFIAVSIVHFFVNVHSVYVHVPWHWMSIMTTFTVNVMLMFIYMFVIMCSSDLTCTIKSGHTCISHDATLCRTVGVCAILELKALNTICEIYIQ